MPHVCVLVVGDLGRSPRMQYHALSLAEAGHLVSLVGTAGSPVLAQLEAHARVRVVRLAAFAPPAVLPYPCRAALKLPVVAVQLARALAALPHAAPLDVVLAQTPPALPTLPAAWLAVRWHGARLVVDWHNLGFTVLANARSVPLSHPLVAVYRLAERAFGRRADGHLCVSAAMQAWLAAPAGFGLAPLPAVAHDRPPAWFAPATPAAAHALFLRLRDDPGFAAAARQCAAPGGAGAGTEHTLLTYRASAGAAPAWRPGRPAVLFSSTSWSADEDFGILLGALERLDREHRPGLPFVLVVVTGKGPTKAMYVAKMAAMSLRRVAVVTAWLEPEDYPTMVGCADLGVCLHDSTSKVDLPMKVVDMLGAGVPVAALDYGPCLRELLVDGENGVTFSDADSLAGRLATLLRGFPDAAALRPLRAGAAAVGRWDANWTATVLPEVQRCAAAAAAARGPGRRPFRGPMARVLSLFFFVMLGVLVGRADGLSSGGAGPSRRRARRRTRRPAPVPPIARPGGPNDLAGLWQGTAAGADVPRRLTTSRADGAFPAASTAGRRRDIDLILAEQWRFIHAPVPSAYKAPLGPEDLQVLRVHSDGSVSPDSRSAGYAWVAHDGTTAPVYAMGKLLEGVEVYTGGGFSSAVLCHGGGSIDEPLAPNRVKASRAEAIALFSAMVALRKWPGSIVHVTDSQSVAKRYMNLPAAAAEPSEALSRYLLHADDRDVWDCIATLRSPRYVVEWRRGHAERRPGQWAMDEALNAAADVLAREFRTAPPRSRWRVTRPPNWPTVRRRSDGVETTRAAAKVLADIDASEDWGVWRAGEFVDDDEMNGHDRIALVGGHAGRARKNVVQKRIDMPADVARAVERQRYREAEMMEIAEWDW